MRLVYLNADPGVPLFGSKGASVHVRGLVRALAPQVSKLTVVTARRNPRSGIAHDEGIPAEIFEPKGGDGGIDAELSAFALNDRIEELLGELHERGDVDGIYERHSLAGIAGAEAARRFGVPRVVELNAPLVEEARRHRGLRLRSLAAFVERRNLIEADRVVCVSEELRRHAIALGVAPERIAVIPNGYDEALFRRATARRRSRGGSDSSPFTIVFVGGLRPWHGLDVLVEAFARVVTTRPACRLLVVGGGPLTDVARRQLEGRVPTASFEITGELDHARVPALLEGADVAIAPYPATDRFYFSPLKVVEYAAAGLPIVASAIGQIAELFVNDESALLVPPGDAAATARAIERLADDPRLRERLGEGARAAVTGRSWNDVAARVAALLESVTNPASSAEILR